jgi:hypothetical protein
VVVVSRRNRAEAGPVVGDWLVAAWRRRGGLLEDFVDEGPFHFVLDNIGPAVAVGGILEEASQFLLLLEQEGGPHASHGFSDSFFSLPWLQLGFGPGRVVVDVAGKTIAQGVGGGCHF